MIFTRFRPTLLAPVLVAAALLGVGLTAPPAESVVSAVSTVKALSPTPGPADAERDTTAAIAAALGPCNRPEPRIWFTEYKAGTYQIRFNINDLMAYGPTRAFARKDVLDIVRTVKATGLPVKRLAIVGAFPLQDRFGNYSNVVVMSLIFSAQTVARINPDGIDWLGSNDLFAAADEFQVAPSFVSK